MINAGYRWAIFALIVSFCIAASARAEDAWRLAGTFNGWNTGDDAWRLAPDPAGVFVLERRLTPGASVFKFVKNGDWSRGHFGAAEGAAGALDQPGADIPLRIRAAGVYRFTLDEKNRSWTLKPISVDQAVIEARVMGLPMVNRPFVIDLTGTMTRQPVDRSTLYIDADKPNLRVSTFQGDLFRRQIIPDAAGLHAITISLKDGDETISRTIEVDVLPEAFVRYATADAPDKIITVPFEDQGQGVLRALVRFAQPTTLKAIAASTGGAGETVEVLGAQVPAGAYVVEIRDGVVMTHSIQGVPLLLWPGNWRPITYKPASDVSTVHLLSEFQGWARPRIAPDRAIELRPRLDGTFAAFINPPDGSFRYTILLDGEIETSHAEAGAQESRPPQGVQSTPRRWSVLQAGPRPDEFPAPRQGHILADAVRHTPTNWKDFTPISRAVGLVDLSLTTLKGDAERVLVKVETANPEGRAIRAVPMTKSADDSGFDRWSVRVMTSAPAARYSFTLIDGAAVHETPVFTTDIDPIVEHPAWAMGAVWYQIFPERFRNGNPLNDPHGTSVYNAPWTGDWYTVTPEEEAAWRTRYNAKPGDPWPPRQGGKLFHVVWDRRYGGDLQGIAEKFQYMKELGITALYMNPIFEAESLHKYDATDYRHIDDNLAQPASAGKVPERYAFEGEPADPSTWKWSPADRYFVDEFLPLAKQHGIRVVLDGVWNHTGRPFFAFADIEKNGDKSPYKDWFYVTFDDQGKLKSWESWFNTGALPKFRQMPNGDLVPPVKEHLFNVTRRWMDPNGDGDPSDGIDGWRLDVALDVGLPFWRDWRALVKGINPDAVIIAEIWDDATPHLQGDAFDTQMHYPFCKPVLDWLGVRPATTAAQLAWRLDEAFNDLPQTNLIHQNLFGSHDTDRYVSMLLNPGRDYDQGNRPQDHDFPYNDTKPSPDLYQRSLLGVAIQALYTGAPMVYYGDEVGMWGADDPTDRKPFPWPDKGQMKNPDENPDWDLHKQYARWLNLRNDPTIGPVLRFGATTHIDAQDPDVFAFERSLNGVRVLAAANRSAKTFNASKLRPDGAQGPIAIPANSAIYWVIQPR